MSLSAAKHPGPPSADECKKKKKKEQYTLLVGEDLNKLRDHACVNITECVGLYSKYPLSKLHSCRLMTPLSH